MKKILLILFFGLLFLPKMAFGQTGQLIRITFTYDVLQTVRISENVEIRQCLI